MHVNILILFIFSSKYKMGHPKKFVNYIFHSNTVTNQHKNSAHPIKFNIAAASKATINVAA